MTNLQLHRSACLHESYFRYFLIHFRRPPQKKVQSFLINFSIEQLHYKIQKYIYELYRVHLLKCKNKIRYSKNAVNAKWQVSQSGYIFYWLCSYFFSTLFSKRYLNHLILLIPTWKYYCVHQYLFYKIKYLRKTTESD